MKLHASAMEQLIQAHSEIQTRVNGFAEAASTAHAQSDALYGNIAYPLAKTLCHNDNMPRATIEDHLLSLKQEVETTIKQLQSLGEE